LASQARSPVAPAPAVIAPIMHWTHMPHQYRIRRLRALVLRRDWRSAGADGELSGMSKSNRRDSCYAAASF
jgi:hypothetical protein